MTALARPHPWAVAALRRECERLGGTEPGDRGNRAYRAAFAIGGLVEAGGLDAGECAESLFAAAVRAGLSEREATSHVRRGLREGMARPREIPVGPRSPPRARLDPIAPRPSTPPRFPPTAEVSALLGACVAVWQDDEVAAWLLARGLDPDAVTLEGVAVAIPRDATLPTWARSRLGSWTDSGHRVVVPMFDATGALVSVRVRRVTDDEPKALAPWGFAVRGAVPADLLGRAILRGERPDPWNGDVVIDEGIPDFLTWSTRRSDAVESTFAVLSVDAGSWTSGLAARVPDGSTVLIWTHDDEAGERYANDVATSLAARCEVRRAVSEPR